MAVKGNRAIGSEGRGTEPMVVKGNKTYGGECREKEPMGGKRIEPMEVRGEE